MRGCAIFVSLCLCVEFKKRLCQINSEFNRKIRRHFPKFSRLAPKFSNLVKVKISRFFRLKNRCFCKLLLHNHLQSLRSPSPLGGPGRGPVRPLLLCNGAAIALQRRPHCNMTACSLQPRGGPVARRNPLFGLKTAIKNSPTFAKFESHKGLPASQAPPLGESDGTVLGGRRVL